MTSHTPEIGKMARMVKMDYSVTYRENDKLDVSLVERLLDLRRFARRKLSEKFDELEAARADARRSLQLKKALKNRREKSAPPTIVCQSADPRRRPSSEASSTGQRKISSGTSDGVRKISVVINVEDVEEDSDDEEDDVMEFPVSPSGYVPDLRKMSLTERRVARERDQYSAKNFFNARRKKSSATTTLDVTPKRADLTPNSSRPATPTATATLPNPTTTTATTTTTTTHQDRPVTAPASYGGRSTPETQQTNQRPTTSTAATSRQVRFAGYGQDDGSRRLPRRPRSRRELQRLVELKVDPFQEETLDQVESWPSSEDRRQDLLHSLQVGQAQLQARVSAFLTTIDDFNRQRRRPALEHILGAT